MIPVFASMFWEAGKCCVKKPVNIVWFSSDLVDLYDFSQLADQIDFSSSARHILCLNLGLKLLVDHIHLF